MLSSVSVSVLIFARALSSRLSDSAVPAAGAGIVMLGSVGVAACVSAGTGIAAATGAAVVAMASSLLVSALIFARALSSRPVGSVAASCCVAGGAVIFASVIAVAEGALINGPVSVGMRYPGRRVISPVICGATGALLSYVGG